MTETNYILSHYAEVPRGTLCPLGDHGGFSGASIWKLDTPIGSYALKAFPPGWRSRADLWWIHVLMEYAAPLGFVPRIVPTSAGATWVESQGRLWELATWMPGAADFAQSPTIPRLQAALGALAHLHFAFESTGERADAVCPAVYRRLDSWTKWTQLLGSGWRPQWSPLDPHRDAAESLWKLLRPCIDEPPVLLAPWLTPRVPIQPCLCDIWHDHVLFTGDAVTGIIDFGSAKLDHVAVDLARLLGSLVGNDEAMWQIGINAYDAIRPLSDQEREMARVLDRTGVLVAASNWLRWLYHEGRAYPRPDLVNARLTSLRARLAPA